MLDIMRKHAKSWGIKAILTVIILSFVLFFGYSKISTVNQPSVRGGSDQASVAIVNHMAIPASEFRFYYDNAYDRMREQSKGKPVPDAIKQLIERSTLQQLVRRELLLQVADRLEITVTDSELAGAIRKSQETLRGEFDPVFYRHQYLPYFENRFGINFEDMLRNDLRAESVQVLFSPIPTAEAAEKKEPERIRSWTYEVVTLDVDKMLKDKLVASRSNAFEVARNLTDNPTSGLWKNISKKFGAKRDRIESVTLKNRKAKLKGYSLDDYAKIFALTEEIPVIDAPIERNDNTLVAVRLVEVKEVDSDAVPEQDDFFRQWMTQKAAKSSIRTYLDDSERK